MKTGENFKKSKRTWDLTVGREDWKSRAWEKTEEGERKWKRMSAEIENWEEGRWVRKDWRGSEGKNWNKTLTARCRTRVHQISKTLIRHWRSLRLAGQISGSSRRTKPWAMWFLPCTSSLWPNTNSNLRKPLSSIERCSYLTSFCYGSFRNYLNRNGSRTPSFASAGWVF